MARNWITRDEIAGIYEQLASKAMDDNLSISRAVEFARKAADVRSIDAVTPLVPESIGSFTYLYRSGRSNW